LPSHNCIIIHNVQFSRYNLRTSFASCISHRFAREINSFTSLWDLQFRDRTRPQMSRL